MQGILSCVIATRTRGTMSSLSLGDESDASRDTPKPSTGTVVYHTLTPLDPTSAEHVAAWLHTMHVVLAAVHGLTAIALGVLVDTTLVDRGIVPITLTFHDRPGAYDRPTWSTETVTLAEGAPIGYWIVLFLCLASLDHFLVAFPFRAAYERQVASRCNHFRCAEYTLSFSLMSCVIVVLCNGNDGAFIALSFTLSAACIGFGWVNEALCDSRNAWLTLTSWLAIALVWVLNVVLLVHEISRVPNFVWPILAVLLALESTFGIVPYLGRSRPYWKQEVAFGVLSLVAKQMLAWMTYSGVHSLPAI